MNFIENYPLLKLNTFGIDVKAKYFTSINTINELIEVTKTNMHVWRTYTERKTNNCKCTTCISNMSS